MKKISILSLMAIMMLSLSSCSDDDDDAPVLGAKVFVTVKNSLGIIQSNEPVYLFKDKDVNENSKPEDADKSMVTNGEGVAEFSLNLTELNITESKTTLYFAYFYTVGDKVLYIKSEGITVKRDETKHIELRIPI